MAHLLPFSRPQQVSIPDQYFDLAEQAQLSLAAQAVLLQLLRLTYGFRKDWCIISQRRLAARCACGVRAVRSGLQELEDRGIVQVTMQHNQHGHHAASRIELPWLW